jgi:lysophospholipase L1-like esterase
MGGRTGAGGASGTGAGGGPSAGGGAGRTMTAGGSHGGASSAAGGSQPGGAGGTGTNGGAKMAGRAGSSNGNAGSAQAGTGAATAGGGGSGGGFVGTMKIMPIGDSTTQSTCWRADLWQTLTTNHAGHFDFVGTHQSDNGCSPSNYDQDNEAYGSSLLSEAVSGTFANDRMCSPAAASGPCPKMSDFDAAFNTYKPNVALIHYGTNDVWNSVPTAQIMTGFDDLVDGLRAANPNVTVFVAKIIPMNVTSMTCSGCTCSACNTNIAALSAALDTWAPTKSTAASPVAIVDQNTGFDATTDTRDGVHPNDSGSAKMAAKWDAVLEPLF